MEITVNSVTLEHFYRFVCVYIYSLDAFIFQTVYRIKFLLSRAETRKVGTRSDTIGGNFERWNCSIGQLLTFIYFVSSRIRIVYNLCLVSSDLSIWRIIKRGSEINIDRGNKFNRLKKKENARTKNLHFHDLLLVRSQNSTYPRVKNSKRNLSWKKLTKNRTSVKRTRRVSLTRGIR